MTIHLFDLATDQEIGVLSEDQFVYLQEHLESEDADDDDYYLNRTTLDSFESDGCDPMVVALLRKALGTRDEMEVRWQREESPETSG